MSRGEPISRRALVWLIVCQFVVVLPHLGRVPLWILAVYSGSALWRLQMHRQRAGMPARWLRFLLGVGGGMAVFFSYGTLIGLEPMVGLLLVATGLKLLEALRDIDAQILVALGFFICITEFLFSQSLPVVAFTLLCTLMLVTTLIALNQRDGSVGGLREPTLALKMLALAVPLMVVLFLLFPRIGPLWSVPSRTGQGVTGMSDILRPGEVSKLGRSAEIAFRARFDSDIPSREQLYWRGMVMNEFDDGAWKPLSWREHPPSERVATRPETRGAPISYDVILEPTLQRWLYALPYAESETSGVIEAWDYRLGVRAPVESQFGYRVDSWLGSPLQPVLSEWRRRFETQFPPDLNPRTRALVADWRRNAQSPEQVVATALNFFRREPFYYTLEPTPIADANFVDRFLFDTRRGFCEHYAYSFVSVMRMAQIPARIVAGYQGGEINPLNNTVVVRQFDAHAWAEVWLEGRGWVRIDPTAAVSPERIELGLEAALADDPSFLADSPLSAYRFRGISAINWLRMRYDALAWQWQSFIVGFDSEGQVDFLEQWLGDIDASRLLIWLGGVWAAILLPMAWVLNRSRSSDPSLPAERAFRKLEWRLRQRGLVRRPGESPYALLHRAQAHLGADDPLLLRLEQVAQALYQSPARTA